MSTQAPEHGSRRRALVSAVLRLLAYVAVLAVLAAAAYVVGRELNPCTIEGDSCDDDFFWGTIFALWTVVVGVVVCVVVEVVRFVRRRRLSS